MTPKYKKAKKKARRTRVGRIELQASADDLFWAEVEKAGPEAQWNRPRKQMISLRLDPEVVEWLKSLGPGYQTRINRILRGVMVEWRKWKKVDVNS
jgi:uncharacterized protein (DUF4415 family)